MTITLSEINIYPLKSGAGLTLDAVEFDDLGPKGDRRWMVVNAEGRFLTQRQEPRMKLLVAHEHQAGLSLQAPGITPLVVVARPSRPCRVVVWQDEVQAEDAGDMAAVWLSSVLGQTVRLVYLPSEARRGIDPDYSAGPRYVSFADGFPVLLISEASLEDLNSRLDAPVPMSRFRPNVVVRGCAPYAEDSWKAIQIGEMVFDVVKPCTRCVMTTINDEAEPHPRREPLRTLGQYRRDERGILFGQNLIHRASGRLTKGDAVTLLD